MTVVSVESLTQEATSALTTVGALEDWLERRLGGAISEEMTSNAFRELTRYLLGDSPPRVADWEHLVTKTSVRSLKPDGKPAYEACRAAIERLSEMAQSRSLSAENADEIVTMTSALTLVIAAQRKLRQVVELTIGMLCDEYPDCLATMADRSQDIWRRHGQMSGVEGPFVWDQRNQEWRLRQDFKSYRP